MSSSLDEYLSFNTTITNTNKILEEEMKSDYDLCIKQPAEYRKKVDAISDLFHLGIEVLKRIAAKKLRPCSDREESMDWEEVARAMI